jgi:hypothetical protein
LYIDAISSQGKAMQVAPGRRFNPATATTGLAVSMVLLLGAPPARSEEALAVSGDRVWQAIDEAPLLASPTERWLVPQTYRTFRLDASALRGILDRAPAEFTAAPAAAILTIPMPNGTFARFAISDSPIMEAELAAKFPDIKTYSGHGIDDPTATIRFDVTPSGFHAMVIAAGSTVYIDPFSRGDVSHYISYDKRDYKRSGELPRCLLDDSAEPFSTPGPESRANTAGVPTPLTPVGTTLRTYRLAVAADVEYTAFHGGTVPAGLAAVVTTINRVTGIYEREFAARLVLVANEASIIYTTEPDPYTNSSPSTLLSQNQANLDAVIGNANYDIGHVFTTGGGGLASLGVVCTTGSKARSETGQSAPVGDPYDVDYVAHEMGHQFGGRHTFNGTTANCGGGNRSSTAAYEPGSGSTIMAYAGICGAENLQPHSDDYFHTKSFDEIVAYIGGGGGVCPTSTATGNLPPTVDAGLNFTIPISTPFVLTAAGSDPDGDPITYCWEQFDLGTAAPPNTDNGTRPIFRSFNPVTSPSRTFPRIADIISGVPTHNESDYELSRDRPGQPGERRGRRLRRHASHLDDRGGAVCRHATEHRPDLARGLDPRRDLERRGDGGRSGRHRERHDLPIDRRRIDLSDDSGGEYAERRIRVGDHPRHADGHGPRQGRGDREHLLRYVER